MKPQLTFFLNQTDWNLNIVMTDMRAWQPVKCQQMQEFHAIYPKTFKALWKKNFYSLIQFLKIALND